MRRSTVVASGFCVAIGLALCWVFGSLATQPSASPGPPVMPGVETVCLKASDGTGIAGSYWPGSNPTAPAVLLLHGNGASRGQMLATAKSYAPEFAVLAIDLRGHGQSAQVSRSFGLFEARDARAAFDWLKNRQKDAPVGIVGISLGGAAALLGDDGPLPTPCLVLQAVYPTIRQAIANRMRAQGGAIVAAIGAPLLTYQSLPRFGVWPSRISPIAAIKDFDGRVLVIGGAEDRYTPPDETRALYDAAGGEKQLWIVGNADHAALSALADDAYFRRTKAFFRDCLKPR